jgi:hypothetical protein
LTNRAELRRDLGAKQNARRGGALAGVMPGFSDSVGRLDDAITHLHHLSALPGHVLGGAARGAVNKYTVIPAAVVGAAVGGALGYHRQRKENLNKVLDARNIASQVQAQIMGHQAKTAAHIVHTPHGPVELTPEELKQYNQGAGKAALKHGLITAGVSGATMALGLGGAASLLARGGAGKDYDDLDALHRVHVEEAAKWRSKLPMLPDSIINPVKPSALNMPRSKFVRSETLRSGLIGAAAGGAYGAASGGVAGAVGGHQKQRRENLVKILEARRLAASPPGDKVADSGHLRGKEVSAAYNKLLERYSAAGHSDPKAAASKALLKHRTVTGFGKELGYEFTHIHPVSGGKFRVHYTKTASLSEYSSLFDRVVAGDLGPDARTALHGISEALDESLDSFYSSKQATATSEETELSPDDARRRRIAELLRKREHTGVATGSASPNPPRGE